MIDGQSAAFFVFAGIALVCALTVVLKRNPVASAFSLVLVFFAFAGIYASLDAHLIAALQVLVYAGAIMVLFLFVIMLLNADAPASDFGRTPWSIKIGAPIGGLAFVMILVAAFRKTVFEAPRGIGGVLMTPERIEQAGGNTQVISHVLFSDYILPFELTSVLLLTGIVGAVAIAKRNQPRRKGAPR